VTGCASNRRTRSCCRPCRQRHSPATCHITVQC
jgi:hypothetical protein